MIDKHTVGRLMGTRPSITNNPLLAAQLARKNEAVMKHEDALQAIGIVQALRDSNKPLLSTLRSGNNALTTVVAEGVRYEEKQTKLAEKLLGEAIKSNELPPIMVDVLGKNLNTGKELVKKTENLNDLLYRSNVVVHAQERKEDLEFQEKEKFRDIKRLDALLKIESYLNPRKAGGGLLGKMFSGLKVVGGAVVGGAALGIGKMVKGIITGQAFMTAGALISGTSHFLNDTIKFIGKPLGLTNAAGTKMYYSRLLKGLPVVGAVIGTLLGAVNAVKGFSNAADVLGIDPADLKITDQLAAGVGGFLKTITFGLSEYVANFFGYENTERAIKAAFDKIKSFAPEVEQIVERMVGFASNAMTAVSEFVGNELARYHSADSLTTYLKDAGSRFQTTVKDVYASVSASVGAMMTQASTAIHNFFSAEDVTPDGTVIQRYLSTSELYSKLRGLGEDVARSIGQKVGLVVTAVSTQVSTALSDIFTREDVTPDGTVVRRYLTSREVADAMSNAVGVVVRSSFVVAGKFVEGLFSNAAEGPPDLRFPHEKMRDFIRGGFDLLSAGVNASILFAYNMAADAISSFFKNDPNATFPPSMLTEALKEIGLGVVRVFTGAVSTLADRLWESVSSPEFVGPVMESISSIGHNIVAPLGWVVNKYSALASLLNTHIVSPLSAAAVSALPAQVMSAVNYTVDKVQTIGRFIANLDTYLTNLGNGMRTFQDIKIGTELRVFEFAGRTVRQTVEVMKSVETTFQSVSWVSDFFLGIGRVASGLKGAVTLVADVGKFVGKFAWPIQVAVSIFDFFTGFTDAVSSERLGKEIDKLTMGDKLASGIGSIMKGLVDFPMMAVNWVGKKLLGDWFDIGSGEDVGRLVSKGLERAMRIATGDATAGEVAQQLFEVIGFMPMTVGRWFLNNLFGTDIPSLENASGAIKEWVDKKLATFSLQESIIDPVVNTLKGIGQWFSDTFSFDNIKKLVVSSLQRVPGGETVLEWMGMSQPVTAPVANPTGAAPPIAGSNPNMPSPSRAPGAGDHAQYQALTRRIDASMSDEDRYKAVQAFGQWMTNRGFSADQFNALGNAFNAGNLIKFALGGVPDVVTQPTTFGMSGGRTGLMGEAGPEAIMPLQRMMDGRLGVHARLPEWPKELDLRNVTFNLDETSAKSLGDKIGDALVKAYDTIKGLFGDAKTVVTDAYHTVKQRVTGQPDVPQMPDMQRIGNDLLGQVEKMALSLGADPAELRKAMQQASPEFQKIIGTVQQQQATQIQNSVKPTFDSFDPHTVMDKKPSILNQAQTAASNAFTATSNTVSGAYNSAMSGIDAFMAKTMKAESGGKQGAVSDTGATGLYQFTRGTWNDITAKFGDRLKEMGVDPKFITSDNKGTSADPRLNTQAQHAYMRILTENNAKALGTDDPAALYLAHFMGTGGAKAILKAVESGQGDAGAFNLLPDNLKQQMLASKTNMSVVGGKTAQDVLNWAGKKMNATYDAGRRFASSAGDTADEFFGTAKRKAGEVYGAAKEALGDSPAAIKNMVMGSGGNWSNEMAARFMSSLVRGGDAAVATIQDVMSGNAKAASVESAMMGGRSEPGQKMESFADIIPQGYSSLTDGSLHGKRQGMQRMKAQAQEAYGQMSLPPAAKPSYADRPDSGVDRMVAEMQRREDDARRNTRREHINAPPATPPTSPVPSIDSIPVFINDMGLVMVNHFVI